MLQKTTSLLHCAEGLSNFGCVESEVIQECFNQQEVRFQVLNPSLRNHIQVNAEELVNRCQYFGFWHAGVFPELTYAQHNLIVAPVQQVYFRYWRLQAVYFP